MISITTPSVRPNMLPIVAQSLERQNFKEFEWLIGSPKDLENDIKKAVGNIPFVFVPEPPANEGDFYNLNKCWNALFKQVKGELIVNIVDGIWFPSDTLTNLWTNFENDPKSCVGLIGHQYEANGADRPMVMVWRDPRDRQDYGSFWEIEWIDFELCLASIPHKAILDVGGCDIKGDQFAALFEKEMCARIQKLGYKFFLDNSFQYRALQHPRIHGEEEWNKKYKEGFSYFDQCIREINAGKRLKLDFLTNK